MRYQIIILAIFMLVLPLTEASAKTLLTFKGELDFTSKRVDMTVQTDEDRSVQVIVNRINPDWYKIAVDIQRMQTPLFDLSSEIATDVRFVYDDLTRQVYISGDIQTHYALLDYKPVEDFKGKFTVKGKKVFIHSFASKQLSATGEIDLTREPIFEMDFQLNNVNLNGFLNFWARAKSYDSDGRVSGDIKASGKLKELVLRGDLEAHDGFIKTLDFDHIYLDAEGVYPYVHVSRAIVAKADGLSFALTGPIDLSKLKSFKQQVRDMTISPLVKGSKDAAEWTIRSSRENESNTTFELKYLLRKDEFEQDYEDKAAGILGIQRSMEF